jgi:hypothetical protein
MYRMTIEQSEMREKIAREIRLAMTWELTTGTLSYRQANRENIADQSAAVIMALIEGAKSDNFSMRAATPAQREIGREEVLELIRSAYYAEPIHSTAESAWNAALDHIETAIGAKP